MYLSYAKCGLHESTNKSNAFFLCFKTPFNMCSIPQNMMPYLKVRHHNHKTLLTVRLDVQLYQACTRQMICADYCIGTCSSCNLYDISLI